MAVETALIDLGIQILINVIVLAPVLWISGRLLAGKDKAKFTDALWIVVLGTLIGIGFNYFFAESLGAVTGIIASIIMLIIWLGLVKHFFDCGWLKALAISILAVIILVVITVLLAIIGIGIALIGF
jgi:predicted lysophospholipase L1 biosynthesis ABC-type transport system permease subunit